MRRGPGCPPVTASRRFRVECRGALWDRMSRRLRAEDRGARGGGASGAQGREVAAASGAQGREVAAASGAQGHEVAAASGDAQGLETAPASMNAVPSEKRDVAALLEVEGVSRRERNGLARPVRRPLSEVRGRMLP